MKKLMKENWAVRLGAGLMLFAVAMLLRGDSDTVMRAMQDELNRSLAELKMEGMDRPYYIAYTIIDLEQASIQASFGAIRQSSRSLMRFLKADVRVGSYALDNSNFVPASYDTFSLSNFFQLPVDDDYGALRQSIWLVTDMAYKSALETLSRKRGYIKNVTISDMADSFARLDKPGISLQPTMASVYSELQWLGRCREVSSIFKRHPAIQQSTVTLGDILVRKYFLNSEGAKKVEPRRLASMEVSALTQAPDGMKLYNVANFISSGLERLPSMAEITARTESMARELEERRQADVLDSYTGPVLFEGEAVGELFLELLVRNLCLQGPLLFEDSAYRSPDSRLKGKRQLRILPDFFNVVADPLQVEYRHMPLFGFYGVDDEGVPAQRVVLVEKGVLKNLLLSRSPLKGFPGSNGHGRTSVFDRVRSRASNIFVQLSEDRTVEEVRQEMVHLLRQQGMDFGIGVRSLKSGQEDGDSLLSPPLAFYKLMADGRQIPLRGMAFTGVTIRMLKDILSAGGEQVYPFFDTGEQSGYSSPFTSTEVAATLVVPEVILVEEMELKKSDEPQTKLPFLSHPYFKQGLH